jgi:hypothetical protein
MPSSNWTATANPISLAPITSSLDGSSPENVNYLNNGDKIALMAQYAAALATKTSLDEQATTLSISSAAFDTAVANISTSLIAAGAPSNWATAWPDGTTSGPWLNIQGNLGNLWAQVAAQQTALQTAISSANAATAQESAIAAALALLPGQSIVPNGSFGTGDTTGWVSQIGASIASLFGTLGSGKGLTMPAGSTAVSHSFPVVNGQVYAVTFNAYGAAGNSGVHLRVYYNTSAVPNCSDGITGSDTGFADLFAGTLPTSLPGTPTQYQWTAPSGATVASVAILDVGPDPVYLQGVQAIPYVMAQNILAGSITAGAIAAGAITANMITTGTLDASAVNVTNLNASNISTGTLDATKVVFSDGTSLTTASRMSVATASPTSNANLTTTAAAIPGLSFTSPTQAVTDCYMFNAALVIQVTPQGQVSTLTVDIYVDGVLNTTQQVPAYSPGGNTITVPMFAAITGLAAGTHTFAFYASAAGISEASTLIDTTYVLMQRVY